MTKAEAAHRLKEARITSGLSRSDVAERIGRNVKIIGHWETGYTAPDLETLAELFRIYGIDANTFFDIKSNKFSAAFGLTQDEQSLIADFRAVVQSDRDMILRTASLAAKAANGQHQEEADQDGQLAAESLVRQYSQAPSQKETAEK